VYTLYSRLYNRLFLYNWVNYANERSQAALERSNQDAFDVIRLTRSKAAMWTVDDVARLIEFLKRILIYLLYEYSKRFVQPGRLYNRLYSWLYNRLQSVNGL